jgi:predicted cation transporter
MEGPARHGEWLTELLGEAAEAELIIYDCKRLKISIKQILVYTGLHLFSKAK